MSTRFNGRVALVTGAASGIGAATAKVLRAEGALIAITDIAEQAGAQLTAELGEAHATFIKLDVADEFAWVRAIAGVLSRFGRLDYLIHCAGMGGVGSIETESVEHWRKVMDTNVMGAFLASKHAIPAMKGGGGAIVYIASTAAIKPLADFPAYCSAKAALLQLARVVALHCADAGYNIRCNAVLPGITDTPRLADPEGRFASREAMLAALVHQSQPLGRALQPEEVAASVAYLLSDDASMITGIALPVDGGFLL